MKAAGVEVENVEPFASFAEVIAAREFGGIIQHATNVGFDLLTDGDVRIQVKSLRVSSAKPEDNNIDWLGATRVKGSRTMIKADRLAVVIYLNFYPYALIDFPVESREDFPIVHVRYLVLRHVEQLVMGKKSTEGTSVRVIDLRPAFPARLADTPPAPPAEGG